MTLPERSPMINACRLRRPWSISPLNDGVGVAKRRKQSRNIAQEAKPRGRQDRRLTLGGYKVGWFMRVLASGLALNATFPLDMLAQKGPAAVAQPAAGQPFNTEQLDALVSSIALYPDDLLTQLLMASTFPLEVVAGSRRGGGPGPQ